MSGLTDAERERVEDLARPIHRPGLVRVVEQIKADAYAAGVAAAEQRITEAESALAVIQNLADEHMTCTGCPTPWWLKQALGAGGVS